MQFTLNTFQILSGPTNLHYNRLQGYIQNSYCPNLCQTFSPMFSSSSFIILDLPSKSLIHFELILYTVWDEDTILFFFTWISTFPNIIDKIDYIFQTVCSWYLTGDQLAINAVFWGLYSVVLVYSLFLCQYHIVDSCCFVMYFEIRKCNAYSFVLLKIVIHFFQGLLWLSMNFRIFFLFLW